MARKKRGLRVYDAYFWLIISLFCVEIPIYERVTLGYRYADGVFSAPPKRKEDFVAEASMKKGLMIANARYEVTELRTDLFLGDISDVDRKRLIAWRDHLRRLERIDVQAAPDIDWPVPPDAEKAGD